MPLRLTLEANKAESACLPFVSWQALWADPTQSLSWALSPPYSSIFPEEMRGNIHLSSLQTLLYEGKKQTASRQQHRGTIKIKFTVNRTYSWGRTLTVRILIICKALGGRTSAPTQMTAAACTHLRQCGLLPCILQWVIWSWHMAAFFLVWLGKGTEVSCGNSPEKFDPTLGKASQPARLMKQQQKRLGIKGRGISPFWHQPHGWGAGQPYGLTWVKPCCCSGLLHTPA